MKTIISYSNSDIKVLEFEEGFKQNSLEERNYISRQKQFDCAIYEILIDGINIKHRKENFKERTSMGVSYDFPLLKMQFELEGYSIYVPRHKMNNVIEIPGGTHQLFYNPFIQGQLSYIKSRNSFEVLFSKKYFFKVFKNDLTILEHFGKKLKSEEETMLIEKSMPITCEMRMTINDILTCKLSGRIKEIYLESKIIELLMLQINQSQELKKLDKKSGLSAGDKEKLYYAKELVEQNFQKPHSLELLSKLIGLNTFKLKTGFKELFQTTVFGLVADLRMEKAHKLIRHENFSISETSYAIGYKNPQHFSVAFKKKYGITPGELKSLR
jgi:AraC-like DNA-binding protein